MAIANLLGVAGTDVPIKDIKKLMMPFTVNNLALTEQRASLSRFLIRFSLCLHDVIAAGCQWICIHCE